MNKSVSYKIEYKTQHMHTSIKVVNDDNEIMSYQPSVAFICVKQFQNYGNVASFSATVELLVTTPFVRLQEVLISSPSNRNLWRKWCWFRTLNCLFVCHRIHSRSRVNHARRS